MKTLKELNEKCTLLAEHKQFSFMQSSHVDCFISHLRDSNKCKLYTDNNGKFYVYHYIVCPSIREYDIYEQALSDYIQFILNTCSR